MSVLRIRRAIATVTAASGLALGGLAMAAPQASATGTTINDWLTGYVCYSDGGGWDCLWYHPNLTGAYWSNTSSFVDLDSSGSKFNHTNYGGSDGYGQYVNNNAASMADSTANCTVDTWVYGDGTGNYNHLSAGWAGNLNSGSGGLRNNEGSIGYTCS